MPYKGNVRQLRLIIIRLIIFKRISGDSDAKRCNREARSNDKFDKKFPLSLPLNLFNFHSTMYCNSIIKTKLLRVRAGKVTRRK